MKFTFCSCPSFRIAFGKKKRQQSVQKPSNSALWCFLFLFPTSSSFVKALICFLLLNFTVFHPFYSHLPYLVLIS